MSRSPLVAAARVRHDGLVMSGGEPAGVAFPASADGRRSTSALGRAVVADALNPVDPAAARAAEREANWRTGYPAHFCGLIEAGLAGGAGGGGAVARGGGPRRGGGGGERGGAAAGTGAAGEA